MEGIMIEVEKCWPIKKEIFSGLQKIIRQVSAKEDDYDSIATFSYKASQELLEAVKKIADALATGSMFDELHMQNAGMDNKEIEALFGKLT